MCEYLTKEQRQDLLDRLQAEHDVETARNKIREIIENSDPDEEILCMAEFTDEDYMHIATMFRLDHDDDVADNEQWERIARELVATEDKYAECKEIQKLYNQYKADYIANEIPKTVLDKTLSNFKKYLSDTAKRDVSAIMTMTFERYVETYGFANGKYYINLETFCESEIHEYL